MCRKVEGEVKKEKSRSAQDKITLLIPAQILVARVLPNVNKDALAH